MATISSPEVINILIENNGFYPGDENRPPVTKIVEYRNQWGGKSTAIVYQNENQNRYEESPVCFEVKTIWIRS